MNDTNQIIHTKLFGECWHEWGNPKGKGFKIKLTCLYCGWSSWRTHIPNNPEYDSDLNLAFAAQAKAIERFGESPYCFALLKIVGTNSAAIIADAQNRCAAIVKLLENEK